jgi:hypothetical protein
MEMMILPRKVLGVSSLPINKRVKQEIKGAKLREMNC